MNIEDIRPGAIVMVDLPWDDSPRVAARVISVRGKDDGRPGGVFAARPVTVEWIGTPKIPGRVLSRYNTFDPDKIHPVRGVYLSQSSTMPRDEFGLYDAPLVS